MEPILYLVHRIPFPPNKGDKIRSYHLLRFLAKNYRIYLGTFVDNKTDLKYIDNVESLCAEVFVERLNPATAKLRSLSGFLSSKPLSLPYYYKKSLSSWVQLVTNKHKIKKVVIFSSVMAQYVEQNLSGTEVSIIDFVDIDSDKWSQYAEKMSWPFSWIYKREAKTLFQYEKYLSEKFSRSFFVSKLEASLFKEMVKSESDRVYYFNNGVDFSYFDPKINLINPFPCDELTLVFTGAMDYWANVDAVCWFVECVLPKILQKLANVKFYIVGGNPTEQVVRLQLNSKVCVTGMVKDMRPYIKFADVIVVPLRIARGVQNKVLEAMAFNKLVVATQAAVDGIEECEWFAPDVSDNADEMANMCINNLSDKRLTSKNISSRKCILENYNWDRNLSIVRETLEIRT